VFNLERSVGGVRGVFEESSTLIVEYRDRRLAVPHSILTRFEFFRYRGRTLLIVLAGKRRADRIARNGDTANKIGTYPLAVLAREHGIPFYVVAPTSTVDLSLPNGEGIPIEEREETEVLVPYGCRLAPEGARAWNPAFDVTPGELISAIVTEMGVITPPYHETLPAALA